MSGEAQLDGRGGGGWRRDIVQAQRPSRDLECPEWGGSRGRLGWAPGKAWLGWQLRRVSLSTYRKQTPVLGLETQGEAKSH